MTTLIPIVRNAIVRYVELSGFRKPRFGPRFSPRDYRAM